MTPASGSYAPQEHYDRVTPAWTLLLGSELHYGVFRSPDDPLETATGELTRLMASALAPEAGQAVLDVGCGTGTQTCLLAESFGVTVLGITTSAVGVELASARARARGLDGRVRFEQRDGMRTELPDASFDGVWALESSHLMRRRDQLLAECARVLRPGGRLALCDIVLRRELTFAEVRSMRRPLQLLREVFGDARMEPLALYAATARENGLTVEDELDLTDATRPTFARWRANAERHRTAVVEALGVDDWQRFVEATAVLERFWDEGILGYGLLAASLPRQQVSPPSTTSV